MTCLSASVCLFLFCRAAGGGVSDVVEIESIPSISFVADCSMTSCPPSDVGAVLSWCLEIASEGMSSRGLGMSSRGLEMISSGMAS